VKTSSTTQRTRRSTLLQRAAPWAGVLCVAAALAGCAVPRNRAPIEERNVGAARSAAPAAAPSATTAPVAPGGAVALPVPATPSGVDPTKPPPPGAENAGKPGYYTVKPGDTMIRIGLETGQNWKDIARWNSLDNPNVVEVGQVLRVVPPGADPTQASARPVTAARVEARPLDAAPRSGAPANGAATSAPATTVAAAPAAALPPPTPIATLPPAVRGDDDIAWAWPASGSVLKPFDETHSKGLAISGRSGDPVLAAADGRVVYAGSGLRGYGNLVIVKHNATYLTAYAHNQTLLVKEDQNVRRGQKIAEMGSTDADRVQLHFEIRKQGKPVDPAKLLPQR
jgi:lipoprotein NlpD